EDKLCNKTLSALDYLLRYKQFSYILEALKNLDTGTRLSRECCERLVESGATNVIFTLIRCCNRSVPCMDVITFSIRILLNLSKILESRQSSDPASGENADGAIIVSHLLIWLDLIEQVKQGMKVHVSKKVVILIAACSHWDKGYPQGFTNYRDSKLTRILQNSLGGNAKTVIIYTITPVTLDEALSTLQFASTAKKMKNDPHVTEVSDDGALLKRYRYEIVDLKRRLLEASVIPPEPHPQVMFCKFHYSNRTRSAPGKGSAPERTRGQNRNLTKLRVTSSNQVPVKKMPKRRVTWGGKMVGLARPSACGGGSSDLSFAESITRKRKADQSCLTELGEDEMEISQSAVTVRSFEDSLKDFVSPERMCELSGKISNLELQLEMESQQKRRLWQKLNY
ncbi:hypothetical protein Q5P01_000418, partial [Channa striata]